MLATYPNLYIALKNCHSDTDGDDACYLDSAGVIKPEWTTLLTTYSTRFMVGLDAKFWETRGGVSYTVAETFHALHQRSGHFDAATFARAVRQQLKYQTAATVFGLPSGWRESAIFTPDKDDLTRNPEFTRK